MDGNNPHDPVKELFSDFRFEPASELQRFIDSPETAIHINGGVFYGDRVVHSSKRRATVDGHMVLESAGFEGIVSVNTTVTLPNAVSLLMSRVFQREPLGTISYTVVG